MKYAIPVQVRDMLAACRWEKSLYNSTWARPNTFAAKRLTSTRLEFTVTNGHYLTRYVTEDASIPGLEVGQIIVLRWERLPARQRRRTWPYVLHDDATDPKERITVVGHDYPDYDLIVKKTKTRHGIAFNARYIRDIAAMYVADTSLESDDDVCPILLQFDDADGVITITHAKSDIATYLMPCRI